MSCAVRPPIHRTARARDGSLVLPDPASSPSRMEQPLRVLHFRQTFSVLSETFIYDKIKEIERQIGGQHVLTLDRIREKERPWARTHEVSAPGWKTPWVLVGRLQGRLGKIPPFTVRWGAIRRRLRTVVREVKPDVIHAHFGPEGALIGPVAADCGIPLVTSFHGFDASRLLKVPEWLGLYRDHVFAGRWTTAISDVMAGCLTEAGLDPDRSAVIHVGKDLDRYPFRPSGSIRRFISIGRMVPKKGYTDAVRAFSGATRGREDVRLDIVGDGPLLDEVQALVQKLGANDRIKIHGAVPHRTVIEMLAAADAFLLASKVADDGDSEGMPTVLIEAQASGLPCITTRHSGIPEGIPPENHGWLAEEGDVAGLEERIGCALELGHDDLRRMAEAGRRHVEEHYDVRSEAEKMISLYRRAIE
jgi:colanic acid/amylovoran biosynthesis glycosyltransferase